MYSRFDSCANNGDDKELKDCIPSLQIIILINLKNVSVKIEKSCNFL